MLYYHKQTMNRTCIVSIGLTSVEHYIVHLQKKIIKAYFAAVRYREA